MRLIHTFTICVFSLISVIHYSLAQIAGEQIRGERLMVRVLAASDDLDLDRRSLFYPFPFAPTDSIASVYRQYLARTSLRLDGMSEIEAFRLALAWVGTRWRHHSDNTVSPSVGTLDILERAQSGERFSCVEYARVLVDVLTAYGYPARMVGLSKTDIETRPRGARHVAVEAWSTTYHKWVFLDPQWGIYPCRDGEWLNAYELVTAINSGKLSTIDFLTSDEVCTYYRVSPYEQVERYRLFISAYTGYLDYPYVYENKIVLMMYICQDSLPLPLAFQGMPMSGIFYTRAWQKAYGVLDQIHTTFTYTGTYHPQRGFIRPEYTIEVATPLPWIRHYQIRLDGKEWTTLEGSRYRWQLHRGINTIEVRAVGYNDTYSRTGMVKVFWGLAEELDRLSSSQ